MAANAFIVYDNYLLVRNQCGMCATPGLESKCKVALLTNAYTPDVVNHTNLTDISSFNPATGYDGDVQKDVVSAAAQPSGRGLVTVDSNPVWTANGSSLTFLYAAVYVEATGDLMAISKLDSTDVDVVVPAGADFTLDIMSNGIFSDTRV